MNEPVTLGVRYIGNKPVKKDTVNQTQTLWFGHGDVQDCLRNHAMLLFMHPTVWRPASDPWPPVSEAFKELADLPPAALAPAAQPKPEEPPHGGEPPPEPPAPKPGDGAMAPPDPSAGGERATIEEVIACFAELDKDNDFSSAGKPLIKAVRRLCAPKAVTMEELEPAWKRHGSESTEK